MPDDPLFSPRRLWNAWRLWLMFVALDECNESLLHMLRYYRRHNAKHLREEK